MSQLMVGLEVKHLKPATNWLKMTERQAEIQAVTWKKRWKQRHGGRH